ncbi:hypothetical protein Taro_047374, partial [Colocasia esculenta]|nr:hypothetical protein [Colocasia esculenta]
MSCNAFSLIEVALGTSTSSAEAASSSFIMMRHGLQHKECICKKKWAKKIADWNYESDIDSEYEMFLVHLRVDGHSYVYEKSSEYVKYHEDEEEEDEPLSRNMTEAFDCREIDPRWRRSFASRKKLKTSHPAKVGGPSDACLMHPYSLIPVSEHDATCIETSTNSELPYYKRILMYLCDKPFDQGEYEDLLHMVSARKPKMGERRLRGVTKTYPADKLSESYFDFHPEKIGIACCRNHSLKQLRGFKFWLQ